MRLISIAVRELVAHARADMEKYGLHVDPFLQGEEGVE